jgi:hypothetical protein
MSLNHTSLNSANFPANLHIFCRKKGEKLLIITSIQYCLLHESFVHNQYYVLKSGCKMSPREAPRSL